MRSKRIMLPMSFQILLKSVVLMSCIVIAGCVNSENQDSAYNGGITFRLAWGNANVKTHYSQPVSRSATGNCCDDYLIDWIVAKVYNSSDVTDVNNMTVDSIGTGGPWPCSNHQGLINGLNPGLYVVVVEGKIVEDVQWRGQTTPISVSDKIVEAPNPVIMKYCGNNSNALEVTTTYPPNDAIDISVSTEIRATFSEPILSMINTSNFYVLVDGNIVTGSTVFDDETLTAIFTPSMPLIFSKIYTVIISGDLIDREGDSLGKDKIWQFTTIESSLMWFKDSDGDGYGVPHDFIESDIQPIGYVSNDIDCNDLEIDVHPGATEIECDGIDQNCNGSDFCPSRPTIGSKYTLGEFSWH